MRSIANEADIDSAYIGGINIQDDYSIVELPDGMPKEIFNHLKKVRVRNHPMHISIVGKETPSDEPQKPRRNTVTSGIETDDKGKQKRKSKPSKPNKE